MAEQDSGNGDEFTVRKYYRESVLELNQSIRSLAEEVGFGSLLALSPMPTWDNNTWASYPELGCYISKMLTSDHPDSKGKSAYRTNLRRGTTALLLELAASVFKSHEEFHLIKGSSSPSEIHPVFVTFSDFEKTSFWMEGSSTYWGPLTGRIREKDSVSLVGFGHSERRKISLDAVKERVRAFFSLAATIRVRMRLWAKMSNSLRDNDIFHVSRDSFRRALFGAPALEAVVLSARLGRFLATLKASSIWFPFENQLWNRVLCSAAKGVGLRTIGVCHTLPRYWDLRFINSGQEEGFSPDLIVSNGPTTSRLLLDFGHSRDCIVEASALRFEDFGRIERETFNYPGKSLVVMSGSRTEMSSLISLIEGSPLIKQNIIVYRPHPSEVEWFRHHHPRKLVDETPLAGTPDSYDFFICDSISSASLELASAGAKVLIYQRAGTLDYSPLAGHDFRGYFWDGPSFSNAIRESTNVINLREHLFVPFKVETWDALLERFG